jgi:chemotaxis protein MotB
MPKAVLDVFGLQAARGDLELQETHIAAEAADPIIQTLRRNLVGSLSDHVVQMGLVDQTLTLVLPERLLFAKGTAELHPSAYAPLTEVALAIEGHPVALEVLGHADGVPVRDGPFGDNWGLASARAVAVVRYMERHRIRPDRMIASTGVNPGESREARAVTLKIRVESPSAGGEVAEALEPDPRAERVGAATRRGVDVPAPVTVPPELRPDSPLSPPPSSDSAGSAAPAGAAEGANGTNR